MEYRISKAQFCLQDPLHLQGGGNGQQYFWKGVGERARKVHTQAKVVGWPMRLSVLLGDKFLRAKAFCVHTGGFHEHHSATRHVF
jgi:hypothetical protein